MKIASLILISLGVIVNLSLSFLQNMDRQVLIESIESKTSEGDNVYNKIKFLEGDDKDIWLMDQNHSELKGEWDNLKIEIDKTQKPFVARYFQLKNGKQTEFRVACYKCHANGPRAIRANYDSKLVKNSILDKAQIMAWNFKIKHYGTIKTPQNIKLGNEYRKIPLKYAGALDNKIIKAKACIGCHSKESFLGRTELKLQQKTTILHLVKTNQMPPWPLTLSERDKTELMSQLLL